MNNDDKAMLEICAALRDVVVFMVCVCVISAAACICIYM